MGAVIGELLPNAFGVALSPMPLIALLFVLFTPNARANSLAFLLGWLLGIAVPVSLVVLLDIQQRTGEPTAASGWINLVIGVLFVYLAWNSWAKRPRPGATPKEPGWMKSIETATPLTIAGVSALIVAVNAKNLGLLVSAGLAISASNHSTGTKLVMVLIYTVMASLIVLTIVGSFLILKEKAEPTLLAMRHWLQDNSSYVMMFLFGFLGLSAIGNALQVLS